MFGGRKNDEIDDGRLMFGGRRFWNASGGVVRDDRMPPMPPLVDAVAEHHRAAVAAIAVGRE